MVRQPVKVLNFWEALQRRRVFTLSDQPIIPTINDYETDVIF